jgi:hypothetical protein
MCNSGSPSALLATWPPAGVDEDEDDDELSELSSESDESDRDPISDDDEDIAGMPPLMNDNEVDPFLEGL